MEAPAELLDLGDGIEDEPGYLRRIHGWLLWRAGPPRDADACYLAVAVDDLRTQHTFRLTADGSGSGTGPSGQTHTRFRTWKEDLRDNPRPDPSTP